ncbi:C40 family peptidase [Solimonas sp. K1W22B-7]|uniref:C40 family peptidase n=1 Tax=Solimonas sp. K1W22B-7 TaxID=2303331 RepID=UPI0013C4C0AB|nr:C40 family peptidase [Solimonas sp. K1W22B-7]
MRSTFHRSLSAAGLLLSILAATASPSAAALDLSDKLGMATRGNELVDDSVQTPLALEASPKLDDEFVVDLVISDALSLLGTSYQFGAREDAKNVDCSSLVQRIFRAIGLDVPRTTREQVGYGEPVALSALRKGDLLFYRWQRQGLHVAVYMDDGYILHASPGQGRVVVTRLTPSWDSRLVAARRVI